MSWEAPLRKRASIVTRTSAKAWLPELIASAGPEVTDTYIDFFASKVCGQKSKTPVWSREDAKTLLDSIPKDSVSGLQDLALIAAMFYSFTRVSAVLKHKVDDYYHNGARRRLRLHEKGGKEHGMPVNHLRADPERVH
jgi:hypothetical protein